MDWSDVVDIALAIFLVAVGVGLAYTFIRLGELFGRLGSSVTRMTDETVPILTRAQTTVDGINLELTRVDEIMQSAVGATKGAEKAVGGVAKAVGAPARLATGVSVGAKEAVRAFKARRAATQADGDITAPRPTVTDEQAQAAADAAAAAAASSGSSAP